MRMLTQPVSIPHCCLCIVQPQVRLHRTQPLSSRQRSFCRQVSRCRAACPLLQQLWQCRLAYAVEALWRLNSVSKGAHS